MEFLGLRDINFGTYNTMNSKILCDSINKYYEKNKNTNINIMTHNIETLISMMNKSEIDIILSKKINEDLYDSEKIKYQKLGDLEEILITNSNSKFKDKTINYKDLKDEIVYIPRNNSPSIINFVNQLQKEGITNIKKIDSSTMIKILENGNGIGIITKAYVKEELEKEKVRELRTNFNIESSEIGIYSLKNQNSNQLKDFIKILVDKFKNI